MGFLFVFLFALFLPVLSFLGVGVAFAYGSTGLGTLAMGLVSLGLITEWHVRRRMYAASPLTEAEEIVPPAKCPSSWGRVDFSLAGRVAWSWPRERDSRAAGFLPQVKGALALHVRKVTEEPHEQSTLSAREMLALPAGRRMLSLLQPAQGPAPLYGHVAVIAEDAGYVTLIARLLELDGWQVETHQEPDAALATIRRERPDLVVLDGDVVGANGGGRTLDLLTLDPITSGIPVVVCATDVETLQDAEQWLGDHGIVILPKPFNAEDLSLAVHAAVDLAYGGQHEPFMVRTYRWHNEAAHRQP